jgi:ATP-dependent Clp protease ATP-binding subunit ClpC
MYDRFTDRARKVLDAATAEARRLNHEYVGTEHILLALVKEGTGVAALVLYVLDIDPAKIRQEVEAIIHSGPEMVTRPHCPRPLGPRKLSRILPRRHANSIMTMSDRSTFCWV